MQNKNHVLVKFCKKYSSNALEDCFEYDVIVPNWFGTNGKAEILYKPRCVESLQKFLRNKPYGTRVNIVGACANTLVSDNGIPGITIKFTSKYFAQIKCNDSECVEIGAGALNSTAAMTLAQHGLSGLECLYTIPGTIGGAIKMNAGSFGQETFDTLQWVKVIDYDGNISFLSKNSIQYGYRFSSIPGLILSAAFKLNRTENSKMMTYMKHILQRKSNSQPVREKTGGSTFCNLIVNDYWLYGRTNRAWELVRQSGFAGYKCGDAYISSKHTNFIINEGDSANDISELMDIVRSGVKKKFNIEMKTEIKKIGYD